MITVITGPPLAGKSTWVQAHAKPGDLVIDLDLIAQAITPTQTSHDYPTHIRQAAIHMRQTAIRLMRSMPKGFDVWLIHAKPSDTQLRQYQQMGAQIHAMTLTMKQAQQRITTRPQENRQRIANYFANMAAQDDE